MLYRRNRYYDPMTIQFSQPDPIGIAGGLNIYAYAGGDPINNRDPYGLAMIAVPQGLTPAERSALFGPRCPVCEVRGYPGVGGGGVPHSGGGRDGEVPTGTAPTVKPQCKADITQFAFNSALHATGLGAYRAGVALQGYVRGLAAAEAAGGLGVRYVGAWMAAESWSAANGAELTLNAMFLPPAAAARTGLEHGLGGTRNPIGFHGGFWWDLAAVGWAAAKATPFVSLGVDLGEIANSCFQ